MVNAHAHAPHKPKAKAAPAPPKPEPDARSDAPVGQTLLQLYTRMASPSDIEKEASAAAGCAGAGQCDCPKCRLSAAPGPGPYRQADSGTEPQPYGVVVDDGLALAEGQVHRTPFLDQTGAAVEQAVDQELRIVGKTAEDCPYLADWLNRVRDFSAAQVERMIQRYADPARTDVEGLQQAVVERSRESVRRWIAGQGISVSASIGPLSVSASASISTSGVSASVSLNIGGSLGGMFGGGLQFSADGPPSATPSPAAIQANLGPGRVLESSTRGRMERSFGQSFDGVRVHTDRNASRLNRSLASRAFALGDHVAFAEQQYRPGTIDGDLLLAHELAHVLQQRNARGRTEPLTNQPSNRAAEADADRAAAGAAASLYPEEAERLGIESRDARPKVASGLALRRCGGGGSPGLSTTLSEFEITGKVNSPGDTDNIYFERGSHALDAVETPKIPSIIASHGVGSALILDGYASEDEPATLADDRNNEVESQLNTAAAPSVLAITKRNEAASAVGDMNYRNRRKVNVQSTAVGVPPPPPVSAPCTVMPAPCGPAFGPAHTEATAWMISAITALSTAPLAANTSTLLTTLFGGPALLPTILTNIVKLQAQVAALPAQHRCHSKCDSGCSRPAYNCGVGIGVPAPDPCGPGGSKAMMTLCPGFRNSTSLSWQAMLLIHEAAHGTEGLATQDIAYADQRAILTLTPPQALRNTDSYTLLIANTHSPGSFTIGPAISDTVDGTNCPGSGATTNVCRALAFVEKWVEVSQWDVGNAYGTVHSSLTSGTAWPNGYHRETVHLLAPLFGLTDPGRGSSPPPPTADDRIKLAGIHDRFDSMAQIARNRSTVTTGAATESWTAGSPNTIQLGAGFAALTTDQQRARHVLLLLVSQTASIDARLRPSYVDAADRIRQHLSLGP